MPNNETFEIYQSDILKHWDAIVEIGTDKPKDMNEDRRQCDNKGCEFPESSKGSLKAHKRWCDHWTIEKRIKENTERDKDPKERGMYFIKTNHAVLPENKYKQMNDKSYAVYKVGKTDNTLAKRNKDYERKRSCKKIIREKTFIDIGVEKVEKELLKELKKDKNLIQRTDITSATECNNDTQGDDKSDKSPDIEEFRVFQESLLNTIHPRQERADKSPDYEYSDRRKTPPTDKNEYKDSEWSPSLLREILNSLSLLEISARSYQSKRKRDQRSPNSPNMPHKRHHR